MSERDTVEQMLGVGLDPAVAVRAQVWTPGGGLDYTVVHACVQLARDAAARLVARAGLQAPGTAASAAVLLPGGWSVEPADPPSWWPLDPIGLEDQAARPMDPDGWLVSGYGDGWLWLLATWTGEPEQQHNEPG